jgi:hypothetical protein
MLEGLGHHEYNGQATGNPASTSLCFSRRLIAATPEMHTMIGTVGFERYSSWMNSLERVISGSTGESETDAVESGAVNLLQSLDDLDEDLRSHLGDVTAGIGI